jgi:hypothetical protein
MTKRQKLMHALQILELCSTDKSGGLDAQHDELYIGGADIPEASENGKILIALDFMYSDQYDSCYCFT